MRLILASASARRRELLAAADFLDADPVDVDERRHPGEPPKAYVTRVAHLKAAAGLARHPDAMVLGADTAVVIGDDVLGKPSTDADAVSMLTRLSGRAHDVLTAVSLMWRDHTRELLAETRVWFLPLEDAEIRHYVASGEPRDKAGAYAIQGLASRFVARIDGSFSNVVGLPVEQVAAVLAGTGVDLTGR